MRRHPNCGVLPLSELSGEQRRLIAATGDLSGLAALLGPIDGEGAYRAIDDDTFVLLSALGEPSLLPQHIVDEGDSALRDIARLVLDEILEVETDGGFVSGARARPLLLDDLDGLADEGGRLAALSRLAIRRAAESPSSDVDHLGRLLYFAHRAPVTARTWAQWPDAEAVLSPFTRMRELDTSYTIDSERTRTGWILWKRTDAPPLAGSTCKAYISPAREALGEAFDALVPLLRSAAPPVFKVGKDAYGISRPDKFVVYFPTRAELDEFVLAAVPLLDGIPPHGVPFTAAVDPGGLVSWGVDPDRGHTSRGWLDHESWRMWVTGRIAAALVRLDRADRTGDALWPYVLGRLAVEGVDPVAWTPPEPVSTSP